MLAFAIYAAAVVAVCVAVEHFHLWSSPTFRLSMTLLQAAWAAWFAMTIYARRKRNPTRDDIDRGDGSVMNWTGVGLFAAISVGVVIYGFSTLAMR